MPSRPARQGDAGSAFAFAYSRHGETAMRNYRHQMKHQRYVETNFHIKALQGGTVRRMALKQSKTISQRKDIFTYFQ
jgi:hypothetical protein